MFDINNEFDGQNIFFIVGGQRCGTTFIYNLLEQHPSICMARPSLPHPKYFVNKKKQEINTKEYFSKYFKHFKQNHTAYGEVSTSYYEREESANLIFSTFPKCKIIFILRNPVDRAISNYYYNVNNGIEYRSIEDALAIDNVVPDYNQSTFSVNPFDYLGRSYYYKFLKIYLKYFPKNQIKIIYFQNLISNSFELQELYSFLNVIQINHDDLSVSKNSSTRENIIPVGLKNNLSEYFSGSLDELKKIIGNDISLLIT